MSLTMDTQSTDPVQTTLGQIRVSILQIDPIQFIAKDLWNVKR